MTDGTDVQRWARSTRSRVAMWQIEERVLLEHPGASRWASRWRWTRMTNAGGIAQMAAFVVAIGAAIALVQTPSIGLIRNAMDEDAAVPLSTVAYAVGALLVLTSLMDWIVDGRPRQAGVLAPIGTVLVSAVVGLSIAGRVDADMTVWSVAAWGALALAAAALLVVLVASNPKGGERKPAPVDVEALDGASRARLLDLRDATLRILADRGSIPEPVVDAARDVPLGHLQTLQPMLRRGEQHA